MSAWHEVDPHVGVTLADELGLGQVATLHHRRVQLLSGVVIAELRSSHTEEI